MLENKVANSGLIVLDLEDYFPGEIEMIDISVYLFHGLVLREKEFRKSLKAVDWSAYEGKIVGVYCSTDAIVPQWAYMLITSYLMPFTSNIHFGTLQAVEEKLLLRSLNDINIEEYRDERIIIKGCGKLDKSGSAYVEITRLLNPVVKSLMFGEPCSTVPVYKRR